MLIGANSRPLAKALLSLSAFLVAATRFGALFAGATSFAGQSKIESREKVASLAAIERSFVAVDALFFSRLRGAQSNVSVRPLRLVPFFPSMMMLPTRPAMIMFVVVLLIVFWPN